MQPAPNFSPFPFHRLRAVTRRHAALESTLVRWLALPLGRTGKLEAGRIGGKLARLLGGAVSARLAGVVREAPDPHAAFAEVRVDGVSLIVAASSQPVRTLAQRLLGGPPELDAPRPLTVAEHAIWALAAAAALADLGIAGEAWPIPGPPARPPGDRITVAFTVELPAAFGPQAPSSTVGPPRSGAQAGSSAAPNTVGPPLPNAAASVAVDEVARVVTVTAAFPGDIVLRAPPPRPVHAWRFELPIVVGRCALPRTSVARLAVRDIVTLERRLELVVGDGGIGLTARPGAVEARVATEYVARDMTLLDDATLEVTVQLGTARMSLRQLGELAIGQIVPLGRPLAGPYEVRAAGRVVGHGELVDIDGELGVRIVSIADQE